MKHAEVTIGEYTIPLIGIPSSATLDECDCCHDFFSIQQLEINESGNQVLCIKCRNQKNA